MKNYIFTTKPESGGTSRNHGRIIDDCQSFTYRRAPVAHFYSYRNNFVPQVNQKYLNPYGRWASTSVEIIKENILGDTSSSHTRHTDIWLLKSLHLLYDGNIHQERHRLRRQRAVFYTWIEDLDVNIIWLYKSINKLLYYVFIFSSKKIFWQMERNSSALALVNKLDFLAFNCLYMLTHFSVKTHNRTQIWILLPQSWRWNERILSDQPSAVYWFSVWHKQGQCKIQTQHKTPVIIKNSVTVAMESGWTTEDYIDVQDEIFGLMEITGAARPQCSLRSGSGLSICRRRKSKARYNEDSTNSSSLWPSPAP